MLIAKNGELNSTLNPQKVIGDFKKAIRLAVKKLWVDSEVVGCQFHLRASWWQRIQSLGLKKDYKEEVHIYE